MLGTAGDIDAAQAIFRDVDLSRREGEGKLPIDRMPEPLRRAAREWLDEKSSATSRATYSAGFLAMSVWLCGRLGRSDLLLFSALTPELLEEYDEALVRSGVSYALRLRNFDATKSFATWLSRKISTTNINPFIIFRPRRAPKGAKVVEEATRDYVEILSRIPPHIRVDLEAWGSTVSRAKTRTVYLTDCMHMLEAIMRRTGQGYSDRIFSSVDAALIESISSELSATCANTSIERRWAALRSFVKYLASESPTLNFGDVLTAKVSVQRVRQATRIANLDDMLDAIEVAIATGFYDEGWVVHRDRAVLRLIVDCGAKASEISLLDLDHIDDAKRHGNALLIPGRTYRNQLSDETLDAIDRYLSATPRPMFGEPALFITSKDRRLQPTIAQRQLRHLADVSGLDDATTFLGLVADHMVREFRKGIPETVIARRLDLNVAYVAQTLERAGCFEKWGIVSEPAQAPTDTAP
ncbi:tyrosine-type recombinase/integrase [Aquibium microcysteis]|uniref:tyrosine-type recombinase/integrase n=1 Tax=Aquibium microcysteis TaxID=675281 RepID=UPI00165D128E|nr:hypothetical protein [Aquibium microcysteis]